MRHPQSRPLTDHRSPNESRSPVSLRHFRRRLHRHGRPRRGLLQAPPLSLLRRCWSDLHQGHQHLPRLRAQEGGLRRCCRRRSSVVCCDGGRTRSSKCRRRLEALISEETLSSTFIDLGDFARWRREYSLWFGYRYPIAVT